MTLHYLMTVLLALFVALQLSACSKGTSSIEAQATHGISACPTSPNCVSSDASDKEHFVEPLLLISADKGAWLAIQKVVIALPRTTLIKESEDYLHVEVRSAFWGFVDDLKLELHKAQGVITVFSASRTGYSDFGVNRERVENLRQTLKEKKLIK